MNQEEKKIVVTIEGASAKELEALHLEFRDGRPYRTETTSTTDDNGHTSTITATYPINYFQNKNRKPVRNPVISPEKAEEIKEAIEEPAAE